jgi:hypothetical protein
MEERPVAHQGALYCIMQWSVHARTSTGTRIIYTWLLIPLPVFGYSFCIVLLLTWFCKSSWSKLHEQRSKINFGYCFHRVCVLFYQQLEVVTVLWLANNCL